MDCERCRELLSALIDDELSELEEQAVQRHIVRCGPCAHFQAELQRLSVPAGPPNDVRDDLLLSLMDRLGWSPQSAAPNWARFGLLIAALFEIALAVPQLLSPGRGVPAHDMHHLGAWDLALGVGVLVVAWQPERARGLLPMAGALGIGMAITAGFDVAAGRVEAVTESHHVVEVASVALLWIVGRSYRWQRRSGITDRSGLSSRSLTGVKHSK